MGLAAHACMYACLGAGKQAYHRASHKAWWACSLVSSGVICAITTHRTHTLSALVTQSRSICTSAHHFLSLQSHYIHFVCACAIVLVGMKACSLLGRLGTRG